MGRLRSWWSHPPFGSWSCPCFTRGRCGCKRAPLQRLPADDASLPVSRDERWTLAGQGTQVAVTGRATTWEARSVHLAQGPFTVTVPGKLTRTFTGALTVTASHGVLSVVVTLPTELAVASIVAAEAPPEAAPEALKAQAVATRSYLLARLHAHAQADACDTTHCQFLRSPPPAGSPALPGDSGYGPPGACLARHAGFCLDRGGRHVQPQLWRAPRTRTLPTRARIRSLLLRVAIACDIRSAGRVPQVPHLLLRKGSGSPSTARMGGRPSRPTRTRWLRTACSKAAASGMALACASWARRILLCVGNAFRKSWHTFFPDTSLISLPER